MRSNTTSSPAATADKAIEFAQVMQRVRGYGPVKLTSLVAAKARERALGRELNIEPATSAVVQEALAQMRGSGALSGIPVVVAK